MKNETIATIEQHFSALKDPRVDRTKRHRLLDILVIAICAVICGADSWEDVEEFGKAKQSWLQTILDLPNGIPSHDTFNRVFARLDPNSFQECFLRWVSAVSTVTQGQVVAIDGKILRRSHDKRAGKSAIDMVSAWASANRLVLAQRKVDDKSNEITAIPELLRVLEIRGCIVTIDALGCQTEIAERIIAQGGEYVLALKENQGRLYQDVVLLFEDLERSGYSAYEYDYEKTAERGHGRTEIRECWTISDREVLGHLRGADNWKGLQSVSRIRSCRWDGQKQTVEERYHIASVRGAQRILSAVRSHWSIENSLHWTLDIAFDEDRCRMRKEHGAENFAVLRHIALNLLKHESTCTRGLKGKRLAAGWNNDYLLKVLAGVGNLQPNQPK